MQNVFNKTESKKKELFNIWNEWKEISSKSISTTNQNEKITQNPRNVDPFFAFNSLSSNPWNESYKRK